MLVQDQAGATINIRQHKDRIATDGFSILPGIFSGAEVDALIDFMETAAAGNDNFRKDKELFAIRNFIGELPGVQPLLWTKRFNCLIDQLLGPDYFLVKSIYFNKPAHSNWLVPWHQDLTISVDRQANVEGFGPWTVKQGLCAVQPTVGFLEDIYTLRIHLDDCDEANGALKVVKGSHKAGKLTDAAIAAFPKPATLCPVNRGGIMIMRPLLLHSSGKRTRPAERRVIHLEFTAKALPADLQWREYTDRTSFSTNNNQPIPA